MDYSKVEDVGSDEAEGLVDALVFCSYCNEPLKECDTLLPGIGVIVGETDAVKYANDYWHSGCVDDFGKPHSQSYR